MCSCITSWIVFEGLGLVFCSHDMLPLLQTLRQCMLGRLLSCVFNMVYVSVSVST